MKIIHHFMLGASLLFSGALCAQSFTEKAVPLSKQASNGYFRSIKVKSDGSIRAELDFTEKKVNKTEIYSFDAALNLEKQSFSEPNKEADNTDVRPDKNYSVIWANIGGSNSFDVMSSKLKVMKVTYNSVWSKKKQRYIRNVTNRESVKLKNLDDKSYTGYMAFANEETGELFALAAIEDKKNKKFVLLNIKSDLSVQEFDMPLKGKYDLVFSFAAQKDGVSDDQEDISTADMVFIFAPAEKSPELKKYQYLRYNNKGNLIEQIEIDAPATNMAITSSRLMGHDMYLFGSYTKSKDAFSEVYGEYGNILSPGYLATEKVYGAENYRMFKYYKNMDDADPLGMVVIKISNGKIEYLKDLSMGAISKLAKKAPTQKKVLIYDGRPLDINQFNILSNGDFLVSGQATGKISVALGESAKSYKRMYCFHFDVSGNLRAQYGLEPESIDDKFNTLFPIEQSFILSADNNRIYWLLLENESAEGYEDWNAAYYGSKNWYARYYPSMIIIDVNKAELKSYEMLGKRQYYLNQSFPYFYSKESKTITFVGRDVKNKTLWVGRYTIQ